MKKLFLNRGIVFVALSLILGGILVPQFSSALSPVPPRSATCGNNWAAVYKGNYSNALPSAVGAPGLGLHSTTSASFSKMQDLTRAGCDFKVVYEIPAGQGTSPTIDSFLCNHVGTAEDMQSAAKSFICSPSLVDNGSRTNAPLSGFRLIFSGNNVYYASQDAESASGLSFIVSVFSKK